VFITGPAGTGKSVLLRKAVQELQKAGKNVAVGRQYDQILFVALNPLPAPSLTLTAFLCILQQVCASTGIAADNVGGTTVHSWGVYDRISTAFQPISTAFNRISTVFQTAFQRLLTRFYAVQRKGCGVPKTAADFDSMWGRKPEIQKTDALVIDEVFVLCYWCAVFCNIMVVSSCCAGGEDIIMI
jgi:hypothetical protein